MKVPRQFLALLVMVVLAVVACTSPTPPEKGPYRWGENVALDIRFSPEYMAAYDTLFANPTNPNYVLALVYETNDFRTEVPSLFFEITGKADLEGLFTEKVRTYYGGDHIGVPLAGPHVDDYYLDVPTATLYVRAGGGFMPIFSFVDPNNEDAVRVLNKVATVMHTAPPD